MKVREEKGESVSIFYDFLPPKKCLYHQFSTIDKKQQIKNNAACRP